MAEVPEKWLRRLPPDVAIQSCGVPPLGRGDCTCHAWRPRQLASSAVLSWCGDCWGWLRRPDEVSLGRIIRRAESRIAYREESA